MHTTHHWTPSELDGCPYGTLICAVCPTSVPAVVLDSLHPAERVYSASLPAERRREWTAGRLCLATALAHLKAERVPLLALPSGRPTLPGGLAGSISHKGPLTVGLASVGVRGLGVDVECAEDNDERLADRVLTAAERSGIADIDVANIALVVAVHFAAKEAIYKAMSDAEQPKIDFHDIELTTTRTLISRIPDEWVPASVRIHGEERGARVSVLLDGKWIIAAARCE